MSKKYEKFKTYLKKIGSGEFTGKSLNREESAEATESDELVVPLPEAAPESLGFVEQAETKSANKIDKKIL